MWMKHVLGTDKPVIGMIHLQPMPTDPKYRPDLGVKYVVESARADLHALQDARFDGVLFCNEFSIPYTRHVSTATVTTMSSVIGQLKAEIKVPFGVTVANDAEKGFDVAIATGASFVREVLHGAHAGVYGISDVDPGDIERHRYAVGCGDVKTMTAIIPEGTRQLAYRPIEEVVKTLTFNLNPDTLLIYSDKPGSAVDEDLVRMVKCHTDTPVFASNGVTVSTVAEILSIADGCIVGTGIKVDGDFYNPIDPLRARDLMANAHAARGEL
jgi:membrane complex biogenesis BtpA family protein